MTTWMDIATTELRKCTDCGLCLSSCPTFAASRAEGDSPRGRIHLIASMLTGGGGDTVASQHLAGCLECAACHIPCPTGVRFAVARRAHRDGTDRLARDGFERRVAELAETIGRDPGARLTVQSVRHLLDSGAYVDGGRRGPLTGGTLTLPGPMLRIAAPDLARRLDARPTGTGTAPVFDPLLAAALERASGLLRDVGLFDEHSRALARVREVVAARGYRQLTVAVFDRLLLRLAEEPLPDTLRIVSAATALASITARVPDDMFWDGGAGGPPDDFGASLLALPVEHHAAAAPVLLTDEALAALWRLVEAKRQWLDGRTLVTADARSLVRFAGARHIAELALVDTEVGR